MEAIKENKFNWLLLVTVIVGTLLGRIDQSIVNLALPKIINDFSITVSSAGWIATAYILANAIFVPIWGKLGDTLGQKKVYITGFVLFIAASILAGFAWNLSSMIFFRIIQAIAGSADYPTGMAIITLNFKAGKERAQALGIWSATFAAGAILGPLLGGPLIDNFGWRSVFFVNLPIGIVGLLMALKFVPESKVKQRIMSFDWWGAITLGISLSALVLVLDQGMSWGWLSLASMVSYAVAAAFLGIFIQIEKNHTDAIVDLKFFKNPVFVNVLINNFIVFMAMMGSVFLIPLFAQTYIGYTATQTGYLFLPMALVMMIAAPLGGSLIGKVPARYIIMLSTFVAGIGFFLFTFLDPRSTAIDIIIPMSVMAFGMGFGMAQRTNILASAVPPKEIGGASSVLALARNISGAFGIAVFGTILQNSIESNVLEIGKYSVINSHDPKIIQEAIGLIVLKAQVLAYDRVFLIACFVAMLGAVMAYWIKVNKEVHQEVFVE